MLLLDAGPDGAWAFVPPAHGFGRVVEVLVLFVLALLFVVLGFFGLLLVDLIAVKAVPVVVAVLDGGALGILREDRWSWAETAQQDGGAEDQK